MKKTIKHISNQTPEEFAVAQGADIFNEEPDESLSESVDNIIYVFSEDKPKQ